MNLFQSDEPSREEESGSYGKRPWGYGPRLAQDSSKGTRMGPSGSPTISQHELCSLVRQQVLMLPVFLCQPNRNTQLPLFLISFLAVFHSYFDCKAFWGTLSPLLLFFGLPCQWNWNSTLSVFLLLSQLWLPSESPCSSVNEVPHMCSFLWLQGRLSAKWFTLSVN